MKSVLSSRGRSASLLAWLLIPATVLVILAAANAHLVYVAFETQPACVEHLKTSGTGTGYRAAKSSC